MEPVRDGGVGFCKQGLGGAHCAMFGVRTWNAGLRSFRARPVYSSDTPGDKHKMERWLRPGQPAVASVYAPIAYPPLPLLAYKVRAELDGWMDGWMCDKDCCSRSSSHVVRALSWLEFESCCLLRRTLQEECRSWQLPVHCAPATRTASFSRRLC
jgi:hypothetical protein